jgi:hypothetical protein
MSEEKNNNGKKPINDGYQPIKGYQPEHGLNVTNPPGNEQGQAPQDTPGGSSEGESGSGGENSGNK